MMRPLSGVAMRPTRRRKCLHCQELFRADARNRGRQKYCAKPQCRQAAKTARQRRWLGKPENQNYFRDAQNAARVRAWQRAHPGYWRNTTRWKGRTLQDACRVQVIEPHEDSATLALQDALRRQGPVLLGLIAHLIDSTLQDDIAATSRRLLQLGQDILGGEPSDAPQTGAAP
jgi:hypothetical protein